MTARHPGRAVSGLTVLSLSVLRRTVAPAAALTLAVGLMATTTSHDAAAPRPGAPRTGAPAVTTGTPVVEVKSRTVPIRVATFNISSLTLDRRHGRLRPWKKRRGRVIAEILRERIDVIGIQEAAPGRSWPHRVVDGANQYLDLRNGLNKAGGHYALVSAAGFNCRDGRTRHHCRRKDRDASNGERILYNTRRLRLLGRNAMAYHHHTRRNPHPFLAWGRFRIRSNRHQFRFFTTHLDPRSRAVRKAQWRQMIRQINRLKDGRPLVSVGDFNTEKYDSLAKTMFPAMKMAGYGEVLNEHYRVNPPRHVRARRRTNAWISSVNHARRNVRAFGYDRARRKTGNSIDHIFATNRLRVMRYKVVLKFSKRLHVRGVLPSDHNMVKATIAM